MRLLGRIGRPNANPRLDARLYQIFDDGRTPDAPSSLYSYLREISMDSSTELGRSRLWFLERVGRRARAAAALTAALLLLAVVITVGVVIPRTSAPAGGPGAIPTPPAAPSPPTGWHRLAELRSDNTVGIAVQGTIRADRIAVRVTCMGSVDLLVMAATYSGPPYDQPSQAVLVECGPEWQETRVEFTAPSATSTSPGLLFDQVVVAGVPTPGGLTDTRYRVSIEVPDATPTPSRSS
jgi:hypothetical protein